MSVRYRSAQRRSNRAIPCRFAFAGADKTAAALFALGALAVETNDSFGAHLIRGDYDRV